MISKKFITIGLLGAIAVALGALGAHALKNQITTGLMTEDLVNGFDTGVKYQMYHTLAMFLILLLNKDEDNKLLRYSYNLFFAGIIFFSGSLYFLCTRHLLGAEWLKFLGPITPIGGILFVLGWLFIAYAAIKSKK